MADWRDDWVWTVLSGGASTRGGGRALERELEPVVIGLGTWGQRWTKGKFDNKDLDPILMMWDLRRHLDVERLPEDHTVVMFWYRDQPAKRSRYWLRIERPEVDLCLTNPGFEVQLSIQTTLRTMVEVWMGRRDLREALQTRAIELAGAPGLVKTFPRWLLLSTFAGIELPA